MPQHQKFVCNERDESNESLVCDKCQKHQSSRGASSKTFTCESVMYVNQGPKTFVLQGFARKCISIEFTVRR